MYKKYDLFLMVLLLILLLQPLSFAENESIIRSGAELLHDYGIVNGYNGDLMIDKQLTRAEACVLLSELHREKAVATKTVYRDYFSDVPAEAWYAPYVTYAKSKAWIGGYPEGTFKPEAAINAKEWASMMMTLMGYPFSWDTIDADIDALGINFDTAQFEAFNRGEAFELLWQVLNTNAYGENVMLGMSLGYFNETVESGDAAILGYMTPSLRMIRLKLDTALKTDAVTNARVSVMDDQGSHIDIAKVGYDESTDEIFVVLAMPRPTYDVVSLEIIGLIEADGTPLKKLTEKGIEMIDIVYPRVVNAVAIDDQTLAVNFSEPVQAVDVNSFAFSGIAVKPEIVTLTDDGMTAVISFAAAQTMPESVKCFNTIKDDYGHQLITQTVTIEPMTSVAGEMYPTEEDQNTDREITSEQADTAGTTTDTNNDTDLNDEENGIETLPGSENDSGDDAP
ncbi:MAG: hypothetical protein PWP38_2926 [Clostridiales bacterium]|jgi:hypothetical protein|nr:hypothetical protein [Clostridiales bacterium]